MPGQIISPAEMMQKNLQNQELLEKINAQVSPQQNIIQQILGLLGNAGARGAAFGRGAGQMARRTLQGQESAEPKYKTLQESAVGELSPEVKKQLVEMLGGQ